MKIHEIIFSNFESKIWDLANIPLKVLGIILTVFPRNIFILNPNFNLAFNCLQYLTNTKSNSHDNVTLQLNDKDVESQTNILLT